MARITYLDARSAPAGTAATLAELPGLHVHGLLAHAAGTFTPWLRMGMALVNDLDLSPALRELVVLQVGRLQQRYVWDQHLPLARHFGLTEDQARALEAADEGPFDATQRAVLAFVASFVRDGEVSDDEFGAMAGLLPDREVVEVAFVAAQYLGLARLMTALQIDPDDVVGPAGFAATARAAALGD